MSSSHNHLTRDIRPVGECSSCNLYWLRNDDRFSRVGDAAVQRMSSWLESMAKLVPVPADLTVPAVGQIQASWRLGAGVYVVTVDRVADTMAAVCDGRLRIFTSSGVFRKSAELAATRHGGVGAGADGAGGKWVGLPHT